MQQQIAGMESLRLKAGTVAWKEEPMANLVAQQTDRTDRRELPAKIWICGVGPFRKNEPDTIVPGRFFVISQHTDNPVAQVHGETGKHPAYLGVQRRERFQDKCVRRPFSGFGRARHGLLRMHHNRFYAMADGDRRKTATSKPRLKRRAQASILNSGAAPNRFCLRKLDVGRPTARTRSPRTDSPARWNRSADMNVPN
jgi:hypothetical protein